MLRSPASTSMAARRRSWWSFRTVVVAHCCDKYSASVFLNSPGCLNNSPMLSDVSRGRRLAKSCSSSLAQTATSWTTMWSTQPISSAVRAQLGPNAFQTHARSARRVLQVSRPTSGPRSGAPPHKACC